ncbi:hypothetical protein POW75_25255, partial [Klebsiella pneumoniae]
TVCVVGKMRDLILQLSKSSIYSTKPKAGRKAAQRTAAIQRLLLSEWRPLLDRHRTLRADLPESVRQRFVAGIQPSLNTRAV